MYYMYNVMMSILLLLFSGAIAGMVTYVYVYLKSRQVDGYELRYVPAKVSEVAMIMYIAMFMVSFILLNAGALTWL